MQLNDEAAEQALLVEQLFIGKRKPVYARRNQVIKGLQRFWQISLAQHPALKDAMTSHDYAILGFCTEVRALFIGLRSRGSLAGERRREKGRVAIG